MTVIRCQHCQFENEDDSEFCGNCGSALAPSEPSPHDEETPSPAGQIYCSRCGTANEKGSTFCDNCGSRLITQEAERPRTSTQQHAATKKKSPAKEKTPAVLWLLPIWFWLIGGIIAWALVKDKDKGKARGMLWLGIGLTILFPLFIAMIEGGC